MYKTIDIDSWHRKELFHFFQHYDYPTWDIIADVSVDKFYHATKEAGASFFLSFLYVATQVANSIDAMRQRIDEKGNVIEYNVVHAGSTILYDNQTFGFGYFHYQDDFKKFMLDAEMEFENQKNKKDLDPKDEDLARLYFSPIPWISFSGFRHPYKISANHSIPLIVFGKHTEKKKERLMPVGLTLHHGLADGYHAGLFFNRLQEELDNPQHYINIPGNV